MTNIHGTLSEIAGKGRSTIEAGANIAGGAGIGGIIGGKIGGKIASALAKRASMAAAANVLPIVGTVAGAVIGVGMFAKDLYDIYGEWNSSNNALVEAAKKTEENTRLANEIKNKEDLKDQASKISFEETTATRLSKVINSQIMSLGPTDKTKMEARNIELLSKLGEKLDTLIGVSKKDRLLVPKTD